MSDEIMDEFGEGGQQSPETTSQAPPAEPVEFDDTPNSEQDIEAEIEEQTEAGDVAGDTDASDEFPEELLIETGYSAEEAKAIYGDSATLAAAVRELDARQIDAARMAATQLPELPETPTEEPVVEDVDLEKALEGFDDESKNAILALQKRQEAELARRDQAIQAQQQQLETFIRSQEQFVQQQANHEFDEFCNGLEGWEHVLGHGNAATIPQHSLQFQNRGHLANTANLLQRGRQMQGQPPLSSDELLVRSLHAAFPREYSQIIERQVQGQVAERQQMQIARPTGRRSMSGKTTTEQAASNIEQWFKEKGIPLSDNNVFGEDIDEI